MKNVFFLICFFVSASNCMQYLSDRMEFAGPPDGQIDVMNGGGK